MSTTEIGNQAEQAAAEYLVRSGYDIVERNFRRKNCEIDIVARRQETIYFVEVKYRSTDLFGGGFDYIGGQKLRHMARAAETWTMTNRWLGEYTLSAIEVGGPAFEVHEFIESIY